MVHASSVTAQIDMMPDVPHVSDYDIDFTEPHTLAAWAPAGTDLEQREALNAAFREVIVNDEELALASVTACWQFLNYRGQHH